MLQVNDDPYYTGTFIELEIDQPPAYLQLRAGVLGDEIERLPFAAQT